MIKLINLFRQILLQITVSLKGKKRYYFAAVGTVGQNQPEKAVLVEVNQRQRLQSRRNRLVFQIVKRLRIIYLIAEFSGCRRANCSSSSRTRSYISRSSGFLCPKTGE